MNWSKRVVRKTTGIDSERAELVREVKARLREDDGPFQYISTGNLLVAAFRHDDGEVRLFECRIITEQVAEER